MFTHEKFEAYNLSIRFAEAALRLAERLPVGHSALKDQLRRAAISIPLNIAEGTGRKGEADRKRFYSIARGSAMECAAICDIVALTGGEFAQEVESGKQMLESIVNILSVFCLRNSKKGS